MSRLDLFTVPDGATHLTIWTRTSFPAPHTPDFCGERGLSINGHKLCRNVGQDYAYVQKKMIPHLGAPIFYSAPDLMSQNTCNEIYMPAAMRTEVSLDEDVNLMRIEDGAWYDRLRGDGCSFADACETVWEDQDAVFPDLKKKLNKTDEFFFDLTSLSRANFRILVGPESLISMFAARHDQPDDETQDFMRLGLYSCQSFFFYHDTTSVRAIVRLDPRASVEAMLKRNTTTRTKQAATG